MASFKDKSEYLVFKIFSLVFGFLGFKIARAFSKVFGAFIYYCIPVRKEIVLKNLGIAFPDKSVRERKRIALKCYQSILTTFIENFCIPGLTRERLVKAVEFDGDILVKEKLKQNKGMIFYTAHFGNWEIGAASVGYQIGNPIHVIAKPQRNKLVSDWVDQMRETFGNKVIHIGLNIKEAYKVLREKKILGIVGDQRGSREGLRVKLFGRETAVYSGAAALGLKTGAPIIAFMVYRKTNGDYKAEYRVINYDNLPDNAEEKVKEVCQRYISILEEFIKKFPEQWFWMHNIWKY